MRTSSSSKKLAILSHVHFSSHMTCCLAPWSGLAVFLANSNPRQIPWWTCWIRDWRRGKWMMRITGTFSDLRRKISVDSALCLWRIFALVNRIEFVSVSLSTTHMVRHVGYSKPMTWWSWLKLKIQKVQKRSISFYPLPEIPRNIPERGK